MQSPWGMLEKRPSGPTSGSCWARAEEGVGEGRASQWASCALSGVSPAVLESQVKGYAGGREDLYPGKMGG